MHVSNKLKTTITQNIPANEHGSELLDSNLMSH